MIQIRTLGSVDVESPARDAARAVVSQPKRFALLVYLAVALPRGPHRRDVLLSLFWPESDDERSRSVLRQTLYLLRQSLGAEALRSRGDEDIELDAAAVACDAVRFEEAITGGRLEEALDLYRGDFLHGFHAPGTASELEEWIEAERRRLKGLAGTAAWTLAARDEKSGHAAGAIYWARRAVALDRDNEEAVRDLVLLLARLGDRVGAARVVAEHAARLRAEFGMEPGAELTAIAARLREAPPAPSPGPTGSPTPARAGDAGTGPAHAPHTRSWATIGAVALALIAVVIALAPRSAGARRPAWIVAVGPIATVGAVDSTADAPAAGNLLATSLARLRGVEIIPAERLYDVQADLRRSGRGSASLLVAAQAAGARQLVRGTLRTAADGSAQLDLQVLDLDAGIVIRAFRASGTDLFTMVDDATSRLAAGFGVPAPAVPITAVTTKSVVAYRLYEEGLRAYFSDDPAAAYRILESATTEDPSFAMAEYYAGVVGAVLQRPGAVAHMRRAATLAGRAPDREALMIRYRIAQYDQSPATPAVAETLAVRYPMDPDAQYALGEVRQTDGDWPAAVTLFRRAIDMDSLSLRTASARCLSCEAFGQLWWTYLLADSAAAAERVIVELMRRRGINENLYHQLALAQLRQGHYAAALASWRTQDSLVPNGEGIGLQRAWTAMYQSDFATSDSVLGRLQRYGRESMRSEYAWFRAISLRNQGRLREALASRPLDPVMRAVLLFETGEPRTPAAAYEAAAAVPPDSVSGALARRRTWNLTLAATCLAAAGDTARLARIADDAEAAGARSGYGRDHRLHHYIRGLLWAARGDHARAAEAFERSIWSWTDGYTRANYQLARERLALGMPRAALYPLQAALRGELQSSNLYVTRTEIHELLARAFAAAGQRDSAAAHYALVARAWKDADQPFAARRAAAEAYLSGTGR